MNLSAGAQLRVPLLSITANVKHHEQFPGGVGRQGSIMQDGV